MELEGSPGTPADAALPPVRLPLKSALKTRPNLGLHDGIDAETEARKTVRIHSSANVVHEFQPSLTTEDGLAFNSDADDCGTPDSGPRRQSPLRHSRFFGLGANSAAGSYRSRAPEPADAAAWLGLLFTLSWMVASSALIFANKTLMVDHGFHFPFALTAVGQLACMALGEEVAAPGEDLDGLDVQQQLSTVTRSLFSA
jgi:hypothetical protein